MTEHRSSSLQGLYGRLVDKSEFISEKLPACEYKQKNQMELDNLTSWLKQARPQEGEGAGPR